MVKAKFEPDRILGKSITAFNRQELCDFIAKLCDFIKADAGPGMYRGGIFPMNISIDEQGGVAVGPAKNDDWIDQELDFLPPELYWNGRRSPASDVYSIGLLMYYAITGGKLPFESEYRDAQLRRMSGDEFEVPKEAGRRLGEIIAKATKFRAAERYQSMDEMRVMAESCLKNLYLSGAPSGETIFSKNDDDLTEIEKLMVGIIEKEEDTPIPLPEEKAKNISQEQEKQEDKAQNKAVSEDKVVQKSEEQPVYDDEEAEEAVLDIRVPELTEEGEGLDPVTIKKGDKSIPAVQYTKNADKQRRSEEEIQRRKRRPVAVILVLCAVLVIASLLFNALMKDLSEGTAAVKEATDSLAQSTPASVIDDEPAASAVNVTPEVISSENDLDIPPDPSEAPYIPGESEVTVPEEASAPVDHTYDVIVEDVSWEQAKERCDALGGHLVVINDEDEFANVVQMAKDYGMEKVWIGGHRVNGQMIWEDGSTEVYEKWGYGEPSYYDGAIPEDYVLLWNNRGWVYNDIPNDPCRDYPQMYSGKVAYICEYGG